MIKFHLYTDPKTGDTFQPVATIASNELLLNIQKRVLIFGSVGTKLDEKGRVMVYLYGTFIKPYEPEKIQQIIVEECIKLGILPDKAVPMFSYIPHFEENRKTETLTFLVKDREGGDKKVPINKEVIIKMDRCGIILIR